MSSRAAASSPAVTKRKRVKLPEIAWRPMGRGRMGVQAVDGNYVLSIADSGVASPLTGLSFWRWMVNYIPSTNGPDKSSWCLTLERAKKAATKAYLELAARCP